MSTYVFGFEHRGCSLLSLAVRDSDLCNCFGVTLGVICLVPTTVCFLVVGYVFKDFGGFKL